MKPLFYLLVSIFLFTSCSSSIEEVRPTGVICTVTEATYTTSDTSNQYEIDLVYPVIDANTTPDILNKINNSISETFYEKSNQKEFIVSHTNLPPDLFDNNSEWFGQLQNSYGVVQCDSIINVWFNIYQYYLGAAHGYSHSYSLQFNINTGELIPITSFFKTDDKSLQIVKHVINAQIADSICWGIEEDSTILEYISNFALMNDSIVLKFNDYTLCPYAFSINNLTISRNELSDVLVYPNALSCMDIIAVKDEGEIASH